jgi:hypothetical protein
MKKRLPQEWFLALYKTEKRYILFKFGFSLNAIGSAISGTPEGKTLLVHVRRVYYGSGGIAPLIHTRCKLEVRFISQPLEPRERTRCTY